MTELEMLVKAKELINAPGGWIKHYLGDGKGGYCAIGACIAAQKGASVDRHFTGLELLGTPAELSWAKLRAAAPNRDIVGYNNHPARTLEEMNQVFCAAIGAAAEAEAKGEEL